MYIVWLSSLQASLSQVGVHQLTRLQKVDSETELVCSACSTDVGSQGEDPQLVRLYKGSVHLQRNVDTDWQRCSVQKIISAQLLASIENQAVRKFLAYNGDIKNIEEGLLVRMRFFDP